MAVKPSGIGGSAQIRLSTPAVDGMRVVLEALREWQRDDAPFQLHPGDLGWFERFGPEVTSAAVRTWTRDGRIVAIGLLDGEDLLRLTVAPGAAHDDELARRLAVDIHDPARGVLPAGDAYLEVPIGVRVRDVLCDAGWRTDAAWTPLRLELSQPVGGVALRVEVVGPPLAGTRVAVQRAAFDASRFSTEAWQAMSAGLAYPDARDLVGYDSEDRAVAAITVWSAGPGRPGLIEPMGVDRDHRGHGYGRAITLAGAAALRELGSSSALVCTRSANLGGVATYRAAGFEPLPERLDLAREA